MCLKADIADLCVRARAGDQNAMAMISAVRESADKGGAKAKQSLSMILDYIRKHPITGGTRIGLEAIKTVGAIKEAASDKSDEAGVYLCHHLVKLPFVGGKRAMLGGTVAMANGAPLSQKRIKQIGDNIQHDSLRNLFFQGTSGDLQLPQRAPELAFAVAGLALAQAKKIQLFRHTDAPLAYVLGGAAWEME